MAYIFDTSSIRTLQNFYPDRFPSIWDYINHMVLDGRIVSVREVYNEVNRQGSVKPFIQKWVEDNKTIFKIPSPQETAFLREEFFMNQHYQQIIKRKNILKGYPAADPFIIASVKINGGIIVTEESYKENSSSIPNICEALSLSCINLEEFMARENWLF